jgi:putative transcriptional regulator
LDSFSGTEEICKRGMVMKNNIKVLRAKEDMTQEELAKKVGVTRQTITSIERGKYDPSLELAFSLAKFFGCKIEDIFIYEQ